jgi:asparagine synthase (glutamine-hydrolysing)
MFAFAALDRGAGRSHRPDRVGKKPFSIQERRHALLLERTGAPLPHPRAVRIDPEALDDYLAWQYIPAPRTIYEDVRCLEPAHCLRVDTQPGSIEKRRYWDLVFREAGSLTFEDWVERLDQEIRRAVELRLVSDVPFGAFLSGGIDSSVVVGYMSEILDRPVRTFSIGFENADYSELQYAGEVARICRTEHHVEIVRAESLEILPILVRHYGQPFADSSAIPTYYVSRMAAGHVKMVLSGDGGDENFAGYNTYEQILARCDGNPRLLDRLKSLAAPWLGARLRWRERSLLPENPFRVHSALYCHFTPEQRRILFRDGWKQAVRELDPGRAAFVEDRDVPLASRLQRLDMMTYLPFDILTKVDIASMANALEVRTPLLDHRLMEVAATMPARFKISKEAGNGGSRYDKKRILKTLAFRRFPGRSWNGRSGASESPWVSGSPEN